MNFIHQLFNRPITSPVISLFGSSIILKYILSGLHHRRFKSADFNYNAAIVDIKLLQKFDAQQN